MLTSWRELIFGYHNELLDHPTVADVRGGGLMIAIELSPVADEQTVRFFHRSKGP